MLLALDTGNTNVTIGLFDGATLVHRWRLSTVHDRTEDEWALLLRGLFALHSIAFDRVSGVAIASVVPPLNPTLTGLARRYFGSDPLFVTHQTDTGIRVLYDNPGEVGADRIVNAVAAFAKYGGPCIVVDLGTAITFDCVSAAGEYLGGIICAGISISIDALFTRTVKLPKVDFAKPGRLIGTNTVASIQSGLWHGAIAMIDGIAEKLIGEMGEGTKVIATGGQAPLITPASRYLKAADEDLTLRGLELIWRRQAQRPS